MSPLFARGRAGEAGSSMRPPTALARGCTGGIDIEKWLNAISRLNPVVWADQMTQAARSGRQNLQHGKTPISCGLESQNGKQYLGSLRSLHSLDIAVSMV